MGGLWKLAKVRKWVLPGAARGSTAVMTLNFGLDTDSWLLVSRTGREYTSASVRQWVGGIL